MGHLRKKVGLLGIMVVMMVPVVANAQQPLKEVVFDFLSNKGSGEIKPSQCMKPVRYGGWYQIKIENIDRRIYTVKDSTTIKVVTSDKPEIFQSPVLAAFASDRKQVIAGNSTIEPQEQTIIFPTKPQDNTHANPLPSPVSAVDLDLLKTYANSLKSVHSFLFNADLVNLMWLVEDPRQVEGLSWDKIEQQRTTLLVALGFNMVTDKSVQRFFTEKGQADLDATLAAKANFYLLYHELEARLKGKENDYPAVVANLTALKAEVDAHVQKVVARKALADSFGTKVDAFTEDKFTIVLAPRRLQGDELNLWVDFNDQASGNNKRYYRQQVPIGGGVKIIFTTGPYLSWGKKSFLGEEPRYQKLSDTTTVIYAGSDGNSGMLSYGAMGHLIYRTGKKLAPAASFGLSTTTGFKVLNLHAGATVLYQGDVNIALTFGLTARQSASLDPTYKYGTVYQTSLLPSEPLTSTKFPRIGYCIALSSSIPKISFK
jgi:hypothetical protein